MWVEDEDNPVGLANAIAAKLTEIHGRPEQNIIDALVALTVIKEQGYKLVRREPDAVVEDLLMGT